MNSQLTIDPCFDGIRAHVCIKHIPQWPDNSPRMEAKRREMKRSRFCPPILMTAKHEIVDPDSRESWRAAKMLQLDRVPIHIVPDDQASTVFVSVIGQRRHISKSAIAYLVFPALKSALEEAQHAARENLKKGPNSPSDINIGRETPQTIDQIAEGIGISGSLLKEARRVHEIFAKDAAFKAQMEPRILVEPIGGEHEQNRPVGLGAVIAGHAGKANEDKSRNDRGQLELFGQAVKTFCIRAPQIADEAAARKVVRAQLEHLSPEDLENVQRTAAMVVGEANKLTKTAAK